MLGGPSVHPFGPGCDVCGPGKIDPHARAEPLLVATCARGGRPPLPKPPLFLWMLGGPSVHPFGPGCDVCGPGKIDPHARAEPLLVATCGSSCMGDSRPIGVLDSGVGGLTVLRAIRDRLPAERTIYVGDLQHFPYGPRYQNEVKGFAFGIIRYLESRDVKLVVIACNT